MLPPREFERSSGLLRGLKTTTVNGWLTGSYLAQPAVVSAACSTLRIAPVGGAGLERGLGRWRGRRGRRGLLEVARADKRESDRCSDQRINDGTNDEDLIHTVDERVLRGCDQAGVPGSGPGSL